ncbi:FadR/GntR family transcriptional regulator [Nocardia aobensis]|uniref:FadR/GntR family transcriptional regulator n=1 Tax=Nocardia aobensis TaxID=257277 RepID=A0ABW6P9F3_9NOCA|nr:FCD domain-containing protein [Nocardia sp. BSTN01]MBF4999659.1 FadR family transcriptional regulator [Nocardia sp. BSTN01]
MDEPLVEGEGVPFVVERASGEKVARQIARAIVRDIVHQGLGEGAPLPPETVMLNTYGVGRPTLREALRILEMNGLLTIKPGRSGGPRVRRSDTQDLARLLALHFGSRRVTYAEITAAREAIEPTLARLAALNATETERQQLAELLHRSVDSSTGSLAESQQFHRSVAIISHDAVLGPLSMSLQLILEPLRVDPAQQWSVLMAEHIPIGEAIIRGAADEAARLMARHMRHYPALVETANQIVDWD